MQGHSDRIPALDLIRGIAVLGILVVNVASFAAPESASVSPNLPRPGTAADSLAFMTVMILFEGKMRALFSILFGASRKRMIGALSNEAEASERLGGSIFLAMRAVEQGAHIVRVHDVPETVQAIHVWRGLRDAALSAII